MKLVFLMIFIHFGVLSVFGQTDSNYWIDVEGEGSRLKLKIYIDDGLFVDSILKKNTYGEFFGGFKISKTPKRIGVKVKGYRTIYFEPSGIGKHFIIRKEGRKVVLTERLTGRLYD